MLNQCKQDGPLITGLWLMISRVLSGSPRSGWVPQSILREVKLHEDAPTPGPPVQEDAENLAKQKRIATRVTKFISEFPKCPRKIAERFLQKFPTTKLALERYKLNPNYLDHEAKVARFNEIDDKSIDSQTAVALLMSCNWNVAQAYERHFKSDIPEQVALTFEGRYKVNANISSQYFQANGVDLAFDAMRQID